MIFNALFALLFTVGAIQMPADSQYDHFVRKANVLKDQAKYAQAISLLDSALAISPEQAQPYVLRAFCNYSMGEFEQALQDCNEAISRNKADDYALLLRAFVHSQRDVFPLRQQDLFHSDSIYQADYIQRLEKQYRVQYSPAGVRIYDYASAVADLGAALDINTRCAACRHTRARLNKTLGNYDAAMQDLDRLIALEPERADYYVERALLHQTIKEYRMAYYDLTTATELEPNQASHFFNRAVLRFEHMADQEGACRDFRKSRMVGGDIKKWPEYARDCK